MSDAYRMNIPPVALETAEPHVRETLEATKKQIGMIPNMYLRMATSPGAFDTYRFGYERFRKDSGFTPAEQEVVFLAISTENGCEYCVAAHSVIADTSSKVAKGVTDAIRNGSQVPDAKLGALTEFTRAMLRTRGRPSREDVAAFVAAGYSERQILEVILAIAVKTISNYTNHVFDTPVDAPFQARAWKAG